MYIGVQPVDVARLSVPVVTGAQETLWSLPRRRSLVRISLWQISRPPCISWRSIHRISAYLFCVTRAGHVSGLYSFP